MERITDVPVFSRDHDGERVVLVPLQNSFEAVKLLPDDYHKLVVAGISAEWNCAGNGARYVYCGRRRDGDLAVVARLVVDAKPGDQVNYRDGDRLNLRRENLWIRKTTPRVSTLIGEHDAHGDAISREHHSEGDL